MFNNINKKRYDFKCVLNKLVVPRMQADRFVHVVPSLKLSLFSIGGFIHCWVKSVIFIC